MPEPLEIPEEVPLREVTAVIAQGMPSAPEGETVEIPHVPENLKEHAPMLDVHPAHHAATTWRDFFIHITTIVIGLIIAVGLEQTVEYVHDLRRVAEARRALEIERLININRFAANTQEFRREMPMLINDGAVFVYLRQHPDAPESEWPAKLEWYQVFFASRDSAWIRAQQDNVLSHMPDAEARQTANLYQELDVLSSRLFDKAKTMHEAATYAITKQPSQLSPDDIDREIERIDESLAACDAVPWQQIRVNSSFSDFITVPTFAEMHMGGAAHDEPTPDAISIIDEVNAYANNLESERRDGK